MAQGELERAITQLREVVELDRQLLELAAGRQELAQSPLEVLSARELEVFELTGRGRGTREIAERLHLSVKTVESYRFLGYIDEIREQGGDIKMAALNPHVFKVFDLLGFPPLFNSLETAAEAIALVGS